MISPGGSTYSRNFD